MKVLIAVGTRPEAIKLAPVVLALRSSGVESVVVSTGQHPELTEAALASFQISPTVSLSAIAPGRTLAEMTSGLLSALDGAIASAAPDWVIVQGDTTSAFATGLAAFYRKIKVAHVEAGLRTHDVGDPFPEELNRGMLARIAHLHFAPTDRAAANLATEGVVADRAKVVGNTIVDAIRLFRQRRTEAQAAAVASRLGLDARPLVLVTCHRRENQGEALESICVAIRELATRFSEVQWLFPMHPNPEMRKVIVPALGTLPNVVLREPLNYDEALLCLERAVLVVTDSGGLQEEVAAFGTPVVVLRDRTERPEIIEAGFGVLAGHEKSAIVSATSRWLLDLSVRAQFTNGPNPFGDGFAAERIVRHIVADTGVA